MNILEAMEARHSVRQYEPRPLAEDVIAALEAEIHACNEEGGLHIQLVKNEPKAFDCFMAHYGKFTGVTNYIALVGPKGKVLDEKCGYYGQRLALKAQMLGLNSCWVAMSYQKVPGAFRIDDGEKLTVVIALGYGANSGVAHKSKEPEAVSNVSAQTPEWFRKGVEAALLAPTAMNQQKFNFTYADGKIAAKAGTAFYSKVDLGIVKYQFEIGAGKENIQWA